MDYRFINNFYFKYRYFLWSSHPLNGWVTVMLVTQSSWGFMLVTEFWCCWHLLNICERRMFKKTTDVGDQNRQNRHQHVKVVTNTVRLQHPSVSAFKNMFWHSRFLKTVRKVWVWYTLSFYSRAFLELDFQTILKFKVRTTSLSRRSNIHPFTIFRISGENIYESDFVF